jgi:hypothetical protein
MGSRLLVVSFVISLAACNGLISDPGASGGGGDGGGDDWTTPPPTVVAGAGNADAEDGIRRLTNVEYDNTIRALFGEDITYRNALAPDTRVHGYTRVAEGLTISPQHVDGYAQTAVSLANTVIADDERIGRWLSCDLGALPSRTRTRTAVQLGGDLVCSYNANCYRPDDDVSFPNRRSGGDAPGRIHYEESVPAPGRYRMTIRAHLGGTFGDSELEVRHGELGTLGTFRPDGDTYRDYDIEFDVPEAGIVPLTIHWVAPIIDPARRVYVDTITMTGPLGAGGGTSTLGDAELRACATDFVDALGPRAFRRPLEESERTLLLSTYDAGAADGFWDGIRMVIELLLQSPQFLYVVEVGTPIADVPGYYRLDAYELATRLSYLAWQAPPDDQLWEAAASGTLDTEAGIHAEAERLFADPRARETVERFYAQWLELDDVLHAERSPTLFPELTPALREAMLEETRRFLDDGIWEADASLEDVLTAQHTFVDAELADLYGVTAPADGFERIDLPAERLGLLTLPALLMARSQSNQTSPVQRGVFVLEQMLCIDLPTPPEGVDVNPPALDEEGTSTPRTTRERWAQHSADPTCRSCHAQIDPVGFTMEAFDPIGRFRTEESGRPIDTLGGIPSLDIEDGAIADAAELGHTVAALPETRDCFARQWMRFGLGRLERDSDAGDMEALAATLGEGSIRQTLLALIDTAAFRHRVVDEEVER